MTTSTPPELHEELAALDAVERALVQLTTADLEAHGGAPDTDIQAQAGAAATLDVPLNTTRRRRKGVTGTRRAGDHGP